MVSDAIDPAPEPAQSRLPVPGYHRDLRRHLEANEPEMWAWFSEMAFPGAEAIAEAELEILKTSYRLDGGVHDALVGAATLMAGRMGLDVGITLYQELGGGERNARVRLLGNHVHVVFAGDLLELLSYAEQETVLAHELAHIALWEQDDRSYRILDDMVHRMDAEPVSHDAVGETARRLRLHTEVWADAVALAVTGDRNASISSIVKVHAGLRNVDPEAYLRQAQQILTADPTASQGWTHPELHVRVACLASRNSATADELIRSLVEGPDDLDRLDILGQLRIRELTHRLLAVGAGVATGGRVDDDGEAYRQSFRSLDPAAAQDSFHDLIDDAEPFADQELAEAAPSIRYYSAAVLADQALLGGADGALSDAEVFSVEAKRIGVDTEFDKILARATGRTAAEVRNLRVGA